MIGARLNADRAITIRIDEQSALPLARRRGLVAIETAHRSDWEKMTRSARTGVISLLYLHRRVGSVLDTAWSQPRSNRTGQQIRNDLGAFLNQRARLEE